jgi:hypothetical protein
MSDALQEKDKAVRRFFLDQKELYGKRFNKWKCIDDIRKRYFPGQSISDATIEHKIYSEKSVDESAGKE